MRNAGRIRGFCNMTSVSAFYEYMQASRAMLQPACRVLTGWNPPKFGELGRGPVAPSLSALSQSDGEIAEKMIQILFNIDGRYPDKWQVGGDLWPMIKASGASLLMHYETRLQQGEMEDVRHKMRNAWAEASRPDSCKSSSLMGAIHHKIVEIGSTIHSKFKLDNVHINGTDTRYDICMSYFVFIYVFTLPCFTGSMDPTNLSV